MCKTIKQRVKFKAAPDAVYQILADSRKHSAVTGRQACLRHADTFRRSQEGARRFNA